MLVRRSRKAARRQGVQRGGAPKCDQPRRGHGEHVGEGSRCERLGRQPAHDEDRNGLQRILERVC